MNKLFVEESLPKMDAFKEAEERFGKERAEQLRGELEQLAADLERLRSFSLEVGDEP